MNIKKLFLKALNVSLVVIAVALVTWIVVSWADINFHNLSDRCYQDWNIFKVIDWHLFN